MARVFIASSDEGRPYAEALARTLKVEGHEPLLWWSTDSFPVNRTLVDSLSRLADVVEGALVVATPDDPIVREGGPQTSPSANVILEYGYFMGALGPFRVALVLVGDAALPSDLAGVVNVRLPFLTEMDIDTYESLYVRNQIGPWLVNLDAASSDGRRIADLLDRTGPSRDQKARISLKWQILRDKIQFDSMAKLPNGEMHRLLTKYSDSERQEIGYEQKTTIESWINFAAVPADSDDERALAAHLARFVVDLIVERKLEPTLIAISKPGATAIVEAAARLLPFPVVSVNPVAPSRDRLVEGYYEPRDRVLILHDVVLSGRHLIDCVSTLRGVKLDAYDVVTLVQHQADTAGLLALLKENGVKMHAATQFGEPTESSSAVDSYQLTSRCFLCDVLTDSDKVPFRRLFARAEMPSEVLLATPGFVAIADVAPLLRGHVLIMPRRHVSSISLLSEEECTELDGLRLIVAERIHRRTNLPSIAFEHGLCDVRRRSDCGIDHAHLHVLPSVGNVRKALEENFEYREIESLRALPGAVTDATEEYLFLIDEEGRHLFAEVERPTRQFFRRIVAATLQNTHWNWHDQVLLGDPMETRNVLLATHEMFR